jgi:hypothetical protein
MCGLTSFGGARCWFDNAGTLAGTVAGQDGVLTGIRGVARGFGHACALMANGGVKCIGDNTFGQLGNAGTTPSLTGFVDVVDLSSPAVAIAGGLHHTCVLTSAGGVKCWGFNSFGQLGDGLTNIRTSPVDVVGLTSGVKAIAAGNTNTCALMTGGAIKCWGNNELGQLGNGTSTGDPNPLPQDVVGIAGGATAIAVGGGHACAVMDTGGVKCWGAAGFGQLGNGVMPPLLTDISHTPVDVVGLIHPAKAVVVGAMHSCALTTGGGVKCWGSNSAGQYGDGTITSHPNPINFAGGLASGAVALASGHIWVCAVLATSGTNARCWGNGSNVVATVSDFSAMGFSKATLSTGAIPVGNRSITARYEGNATHATSLSDPVTQVVTPAATTTALGSSSFTTVFGQPVTVTATVSSSAGTPDGNVTFRLNGVVIGIVALVGGQASIEVASIPIGLQAITARYEGSGNFSASQPLFPLIQTVTQGATTTAVVASPAGSTFGQLVTFTATVSPVAPSVTPPSGTVTFMDGLTVLGTVALSGGQAVLQIATLALGPHSITATYNGNADSAGSTSSAIGQTVGQAVTATGFVSTPNPSAVNQSVSLVATVTSSGDTPTGTVTFKDGAGTLATVSLSGGTATFHTDDLSRGTHTLRAVYNGSINFAASASANVSHRVNKAATRTTLRSNPDPSRFRQTITLTATVQPTARAGRASLTGQVVFRSSDGRIGTATVLGGVATLQTDALSPGTHRLFAEFEGDADFEPSTSSGVTHTVDKGATDMNLTISPGTSKTGQTVTLAATVNVKSPSSGTPSGTVTFTRGANRAGLTRAVQRNGQVPNVSSSSRRPCHHRELQWQREICRVEG